MAQGGEKTYPLTPEIIGQAARLKYEYGSIFDDLHRELHWIREGHESTRDAEIPTALRGDAAQKLDDLLDVLDHISDLKSAGECAEPHRLGQPQADALVNGQSVIKSMLQLAHREFLLSTPDREEIERRYREENGMPEYQQLAETDEAEINRKFKESRPDAEISEERDALVTIYGVLAGMMSEMRINSRKRRSDGAEGYAR